MNEITSEYGVHSSQISSWKKQALTAIEGIFAGSGQHALSDRQSPKSARNFAVYEPYVNFR